MGKFDTTNTHLDVADREIWDQITRTAKPLAQKDKNFTSLLVEFENTGKVMPSSAASLRNLRSAALPVYQPQTQKKPVLDVRDMDKSTSRKVSKGRIAVDGRIDLHGLTQQQAYQALYDFVENAWFSAKKILLVITGKGNLGLGILRENVPKWLASAPFLPLISEFGASHGAHGGNGALYVSVRRNPNLNK